MAKNKLVDLNDHLFAQLERLGNEDITPEELAKEIDRSKAINSVAKSIIDNASMSLEGAKLIYENRSGTQPIPTQFQLKESNV